MAEKDCKSKYWMITTNNYTKIDYIDQLAYKSDYKVIGKEIGKKCGTPHTHMYIEFSAVKRFSTLKKKFPKANLQTRRGTSLEAANYCKKDGDYEEQGTLSEPNQGERTDLKIIRDAIMEGKRVDDIAMEDPFLYHQYGRTFSKIEDIAMRKLFRTEMSLGKWFWGKTGTGKSHAAFKDFHPDTHYVWKNDNGWQDGYTQQETVIINDFRGEIPYNELLQLVDKWPYYVKRRGKEPMPFTSKNVIITSSLRPDQIYHNRNTEDSIEQLHRRFEIIELTESYDKMPSKCSEGNTISSEATTARKITRKKLVDYVKKV